MNGITNRQIDPAGQYSEPSSDIQPHGISQAWRARDPHERGGKARHGRFAHRHPADNWRLRDRHTEPPLARWLFGLPSQAG